MIERAFAPVARALDPWGNASLAAFSLITTLLSCYGFIKS
ncbi:hypothetical protein HPGCJGGD_0175 [Methylobacterium haplocladii]|nr:hypothetical protein HPGCJGGD_0175 [Methylobacterium haplocladii]